MSNTSDAFSTLKNSSESHSEQKTPSVLSKIDYIFIFLFLEWPMVRTGFGGISAIVKKLF